ncbi:hypothetical protein SRB5_00690 [Streptomyces sp. RB5]|uniref:Uncharacterized protein n=1 Tax=Streptomyces smaragdinus TaxID=2585196 RepID=A0A7K0C927_9ACTN|nr:hypothetical protein [Streptomyces smaragdinus]MQY09965.1 hypothetical protein [Streptomyces smaragdinus]
MGSGVVLGVVATVFGHAVHADVADYRAGLAAAVLATAACLTGLRRGTATNQASQAPGTLDA